jgi:carbamoyl-phosphate synthase large subunit
VVERIIEKERPDALLPTMGGQTALNTALALFRDGTLEKYGVEMIGAKAEAIDKAEDRQKFRDAMDKIGLESPRRHRAHDGRGARGSWSSSACPQSSAPASPWAAPAAASPTTRGVREIVATRPRPSPTTEVLIEESRARLEGI